MRAPPAAAGAPAAGGPAIPGVPIADGRHELPAAALGPADGSPATNTSEPADGPSLEDDDCALRDSPLLETCRLKRLLAKHRCNVHPNLSKALLYVPSGDLTHAPADLATVRSFQVAGTFVGDTDSCRTDALALITARLAPLDHVMRLEDCEHVTNTFGHTLQLKFGLILMCASMIYSHWAGSMPPEQTDLGAAYSDRTISAASPATAALVASKDSPAGRADLALACAPPTRRQRWPRHRHGLHRHPAPRLYSWRQRELGA